MKTLPILIAGLIALLALPACKTGRVNTFDSGSDEQVITDPRLNKQLRVVEVNEGELNGNLKIQITVQNKTKKQAFFHYRFDWYDSNGMLLSQGRSIWKVATIYGGDTFVIEGISSTPKATAYKLKTTFSKP